VLVVDFLSMLSTSTATEILATVPSQDWSSLEPWFAARRRELAHLEPDPELEATLQFIDAGSVVRTPLSPFGHYANADWLRLTIATLLADWACYPVPVDQVSFERLLYVMHVFPAGFRTWWVKSPRAGWLPVGYTGWYPISAATFDTLAAHASTLRDRSVLPIPVLDPQGNFLYLFNYSMVAGLRRTSCSKRLVRSLVEDVRAVRCRGLAAITVSEDGVRVAERFGMRRSGTLLVEGTQEWVYSARASEGEVLALP
jgi:hypothetical protein